ncbi:MAG: amidohydrolase family protein [Steroidobacteraceae bacterium]
MNIPQEEILEPALPIVDCHHHLWDEHPFGLGGRYNSADLLADVVSGHRIVATVYVEAHSHWSPSGPLALRPVGETIYADSVAREILPTSEEDASICAGIVAHADMNMGAGVEEVLAAHLAASRHVRGIRHVVMPNVLAGDFVDSKRSLASDVFREGVRRLPRFGLTFDICIYHYQLGDTIDFVRACPDVSFALNHIGCPVGIGPYQGRREEVFKDWAAHLATLAREPNVVVKLGGMNMFTSGFGWNDRPTPATSDELVQATGRYFLHAIDCFGPKRCLFESNFPTDQKASSYATLWNAFKKIARGCSSSEKVAMFHDNARSFYRL